MTRKLFLFVALAITLCFSVQVFAVPKSDQTTATERVQPCTASENDTLTISVAGHQTEPGKAEPKTQHRQNLIFQNHTTETARNGSYG